jgi:hypothetical protein
VRRLPVLLFAAVALVVAVAVLVVGFSRAKDATPAVTATTAAVVLGCDTSGQLVTADGHRYSQQACIDANNPAGVITLSSYDSVSDRHNAIARIQEVAQNHIGGRVPCFIIVGDLWLAASSDSDRAQWALDVTHGESRDCPSG